MQKFWKIKEYDKDYINKIMEEFNISEILAKLIISRNIEYDEIKNFLVSDIDNLKDPFIMKDMDKFVERVSSAISNNEKICIYGDYDVDGITSITIMYKFLEELGAKVSFYLPDRLSEGYGLNKEAIDEILKDDIKLMITVDCGITAIDEIEYAKSLGIDVCITDHHECGETLPKAFAIVNPKQKDDISEFKFHAGVGIAFKCIMALSKKYNLDKYSYIKYIDIVAVGTISDIVPLVGENRIIARFGIEAMKVTKNLGLSALLKLVGDNEIDSLLISFAIAPRINACGRMGNAKLAVDLLLSKTTMEADRIALLLDKQNVIRQEVEKKIFDEALSIVEKNKQDYSNSIVLYNENWHNGVIGIVASKLVNIYNIPVILFTKENGVIRGSGRCELGFSLYDALTECKDLLIQFGGHELAAGMTIDINNIAKFKIMFNSVVSKIKLDNNNEQLLDVDLEITKNDLNVSTIKDIMKMKPYGQDNTEPLFLYKNFKVQAISTVKDGKHLRITLRDDNVLIVGIGFSLGHRRDELVIGDNVDVVGHLNINKFSTPKILQLVLKDFKKV
jgi:single-stranded-DNA-specific exonuclease